jgi:hypothetical protein
MNARSALLTATVAWNMSGFASGFFQRAWDGAPLPVTDISYALNAAIVGALPFARSSDTAPVLAVSALGALMCAWSTAGLAFVRRDVRHGRLPGMLGPGIPAVLGLVTAVDGVRAYRRR